MVVFTPPAVEPGVPPINIKIMVTLIPAALSLVYGKVISPAVRGVIAIKTVFSNRWGPLIWPLSWARFRSVSKYTKNEIRKITAPVRNANWVCRDRWWYL